MKRFLKIAVLAFLCVFSAAVLFGCGETPAPSQTDVALDLYEEKTVVPEGLEGEITWTSSDESVVTAGGGILSAVGKEGTAEVTASDGKGSVVYKVTVTDSGERPAVSRPSDFELYETKTFDLGAELKSRYKGNELSGVTYEFSVAAGHVSVENGIVTGISEGLDTINITGTYKGFQMSRKSCNVTVLSASKITPEREVINLSTADGDIDPKSDVIRASVVIDAVPVENPELTARIADGEEFITLEGLTVTAKEVGVAVVELSCTSGGKTVTGSVKINVHNDEVECNANYFAPNDTTGRTQWGKLSEGEHAGEYGFSTTSENYWTRAVINGTGPDTIKQNGYKAFSYEIYFENAVDFGTYIPSAFITEGTAMVLYKITDGTITSDMELLIVQTLGGENVSQLATGTWYRFIYDLTTLEPDQEFSLLGFTALDTNETSDPGHPSEFSAYMRAFTYYTTTRLLPGGGYAQSHGGGSEQKDPNVSDVKDEFTDRFEIYDPEHVKLQKVVQGELEGSYKITSTVAEYPGRITVKEISDTNGTPGKFFTDGMHFVKFSVYITQASDFAIYTHITSQDDVEDIRKVDLISGSNMPNATGANNVKTYNPAGSRGPVTLNGWYTVVVEVPYTAAPSWTLFYIAMSGNRYTPAYAYIKDLSFSEENPMGEDQPVDERLKMFVYDANFASLSVAQEEPFKDCIVYRALGGNYYSARINFAAISDMENTPGTFFTDGYKYVKFDFYSTEAGGFVYSQWINYAPGQNHEGPCTTHPDVKIFQGEDAVTSMDADTWYTVWLKVPYSGTVTAALVYIGSDSQTATMYLKNISFETEGPAEEEPPAPPVDERLKMFVYDADYASLSVAEEEPFKDCIMYRVLKGNHYSARINFAAISDMQNNPGTFFTDGYKYVKFDFYSTEAGGFIYSQWINYVGSQPNEGPCTEHPDVKIFQGEDAVTSMDANTWYTVWLRVPYSGTVTAALVYIGSDSQTATMYLKNISFETEGPLDEEEPPVEEETTTPDGCEAFATGTNATIAKVTSGEFNECFKYTGSSDNQSLSALFFTKVNNPELEMGDFFSTGNHYLSFDIYFKNGTDLILYLNLNWGSQVGDNSFLISATDHAKVYKGSSPVSAFTTGEWYTIVLYIDCGAEVTASYTYIALKGSEEAPSVAYLRNLSYSAEDPMKSEQPPVDTTYGADEFIVDGTYATVTAAEEEGFEGCVKYDNAKPGSNYYVGRAEMNSVTNNGVPGTFFTEGKHYISFEINCIAGDTGLYIYVNTGTAVEGYAVQLGFVKVYDVSGAPAQNILTGNWYRVVIQIDYSEVPGWALVYFTLYNTGSAYIRNLNYFAEDPMKPEQPPVDTTYGADEFIVGETSTVTAAADQGFEGCVKYENTSNYWTGRTEMKSVSSNGTPGTFFTEGKHFISFEIYFLSGNADLWVYVNTTGTAVENYAVQLDFVKVYDMAGSTVSGGMALNTWYKVVIEINDDAPGWTMIYFSTYTAGSAYIRNLNYSVDAPAAPSAASLAAILPTQFGKETF